MNALSHAAEPAEGKPQETAPDAQAGALRSRVDHFLRDAQQKLGLNTPFMRHNYTRVTSFLRIASEVFTIMSGKRYKTPQRMAGASLGMAASFLGMMFKQRKQSAEELEKMRNMPKGKYIAFRLKQALNPKEHIRQTLAVSMMAGTALGMSASWHSKRIGEGLLAVVEFLGACILCFTRDDDKAWRNRTILQSTISTPIGAGYAVEAYRKGDNYILASMATHQVSHAVSFLETYGRKEGEKEAQTSQNKGR